MTALPRSAAPAPEFAAMLTAVWSDLAPVVARLIRARPTLAARLALAPPRAVHAVAIYLRRVTAEGGDAAAALAREVEGGDPRALLARALPGHDPRLYRALDRLGPQVRALRFYLRLHALLGSPAAALVLAASPLGEDALTVGEMALRDPVLLAVGRGVHNSLHTAQCAASALAYLRAMGLARDVEALPPGSGLPALVRRLRADLARARPPAPPFPAPAGWLHVASVGDLWRIGRKLGNCVADIRGGSHHVLAYVSGDEVMLAHAGEPLLLACVERVGPGCWHLQQCKGARNVPAPADLREALRDGLRAVGVELVEVEAASALGHLAYAAERHGRLDAALDDVDDEVEGEAA